MRTQTARSVLLVLAVAALVALAGCSGGDNGATTTDPGDTTDAPTEEMTTAQEQTDTETSEPTTEETTAEDTGETTTTEDDSTPTDGQTGDAIFGENNQALLDAGSFTATTSVQVNSSQQNATVTAVTYANIDTGDGYQQSNVESSLFSQTTEVYTSGNETFQRTNGSFSGEPQYQYATEPYDGQVQPVNVTQAASTSFQFTNAELTWSEAGTETVSGVQTTRYAANGIDSPERATSIIGSQVNTVDSIALEAYVDEDGIVRRIVLDFEGETEQSGQVSQEITYELSDIGSTTVPTPDWLDQARQQASN